jgi:hypothetical protein
MVCVAVAARALDLLERYPTGLSVGDAAAERARAWEFSSADIFRLTRFHFEAGRDLKVDLGPADAGFGHCKDGAVWAVVIPRAEATFSSRAQGNETPTHLWLRFHPREVARLFPPETVFADSTNDLGETMRHIAETKMVSSWQAHGAALIPDPKDMTVDADTREGPRRFFSVDTQAQTAEYVGAFEGRAVRPLKARSTNPFAAAFDELWETFERDYAMFVLRPEVDWGSLREKYRPRALRSESAGELAAICAEMLRPLRDLHVWLTAAGEHVPVFNRPRAANANPSAYRAILGELHETGHQVRWTVTTNQVGFLLIPAWNEGELPATCDQVLEQMRGTRGLLVDVRLNGGGSEDLAQAVAGRFLAKEFVYAYSQFRNGPQHTNLTEKIERRVGPRGPWRYDRPVVLLIGQKCMSSNESFVAMMSGDPDLVTMGDHTCGSSGNPEIIELPLDLTVSVPRWIDYLPDGSVLDERGFQPQIVFKPEPSAFQGRRDDLLSAALEHLRQAPLPARPIAGPVPYVEREVESAGGPP